MPWPRLLTQRSSTAARVEHRQDDEVSIAGLQVGSLCHHVTGEGVIRLRDQNALGTSGRPAGKHHCSPVIVSNRRAARRLRRAALLARVGPVDFEDDQVAAAARHVSALDAAQTPTTGAVRSM